MRIEATYIHPREHHNPIEPHATIAHWEGEHLTLYDKTQWVDNDRKEIAYIFDIPEERIRVVSPFVGGAFGSALRTWPHVTLAALGAQSGRPAGAAGTDAAANSTRRSASARTRSSTSPWRRLGRAASGDDP